MSEVMTAPPPPERKCQFETLFDASCIELIRLVPRNPLVRALILKLTGQLPGPERETFDQLKDWIECHCTQRVRPLPNRNGRPGIEGGISINVEFSQTECGRADYSVPRWGTEEFRLGADDLLEIVEEVIDAGGSMDEVVDSIAGKIDDDAWNQCEPDLDHYGDYNYSTMNRVIRRTLRPPIHGTTSAVPCARSYRNNARNCWENYKRKDNHETDQIEQTTNPGSEGCPRTPVLSD